MGTIVWYCELTIWWLLIKQERNNVKVERTNYVVIMSPKDLICFCGWWWQGIFSGACSDDPHDIDHAVLAIGYGSDDEGRGYWIVKNSWTYKWGKDGYVHIARGTGHPRGVCGIYATPSYPIVNKDGHSSLSVSVMWKLLLLKLFLLQSNNFETQRTY